MSTHIQRSALLPYPARALFDLVNDVKRYPEFLPWCSASQVLEESESLMRAELTLSLIHILSTPARFFAWMSRHRTMRWRGVRVSPRDGQKMCIRDRRNGDRPYRDCADALCHWAETCTAVALRLVGERLELLAPLGVDDLLALKVRPTAHFAGKPEVYRRRLREKNWTARWPLLDISGSSQTPGP